MKRIKYEFNYLLMVLKERINRKKNSYKYEAQWIKTIIVHHSQLNNYNFRDYGIHDVIVTKIDKDKSTIRAKVLIEKPGIFIGKGGSNINEIKSLYEKQFCMKLTLNIVEVVGMNDYCREFFD